MSTSLSNVDQTIFDEMVKKAYQSKGFLLRDKVRTRTNVEGTVVSFRKVGSITAEQYAFQSAVVWQDPSFSKVNVTLNPYRAPTLIDDLQQFLFNFDVRKEEAELVAMALGRRSDQLIIDALEASGTTNTIANGGTGFTYDKVREIIKFFNDLAIPPEDRYVAISATGQEQLMASLQFTNSQFTNLNLVENGTLNGKFAMGMNWTVVPTMTEGGLPLSGNIRSCYAWHKLAMGMATGREFSTIIERVPHLDSWQVLGKMFANAVAVDAVGIVECDIDESVNETSALTVTTL
jgi:hypothetical protein